ncbi:hypothetical protein I316_03096 [Kwoniella heveanensis BCC8398]|uniref:histone acetyltransferase n=1 Tax=Kwoniella heveanensis BCC8398 TaxID=1296120 RepID=A0A1B9GVL4_9TREE|nr:hypothetical protein I316_03096 [Kwoniella heveanensis BCC8398]
MPIRISDLTKAEDAQSSSKPSSRDVRKDEIKLGIQYIIHRKGQGHAPRPANILDSRVGKSGSTEYYISFVGQDKRLDAWVSVGEVGDRYTNEDIAGSSGSSKANLKEELSAAPDTTTQAGPSTPPIPAVERPNKRPDAPPSTASTPEREHAAMTRVRNFEDVRFGEYLVKTWYYSPYPLPIDDSHHSQSHAAHNVSSPISASSRNAKLGDSPSEAKKRKLNPARTHSHSQASQQANDGQVATPGRSRLIASSRSVSEMFSGVGKGGEGARGRLWVCDLCFKYMRTRSAWDRHTSGCTMLQPPGRRVYQRGSYTIWEIDGAQATLYCQNLSLFGKLFIDHKSIFFHVENFLFYVLCDAATSKRDQVMAFFSKEKLSYDDYNLACIVTFPPHQNRGFGKLLIEFSYYLTLHPSTRPSTLSPGTPERPLSDLGLKGYTAYWVSVILRFLRKLLESVEPFKSIESPTKAPLRPVPVENGRNNSSEGRTLRVRRAPVPVADGAASGEKVIVNDVEFIRSPVAGYKGQQSINTTLKEISEACHLRTDDVAFTLSELGFLNHRRIAQSPEDNRSRNGASHSAMSGTSSAALQSSHSHGHARSHFGGEDDLDGESGRGGDYEVDLGEWKDIEVVITRGMVDEAAEKWRVKDKGVLDEKYVLL